MNDTPDYGSKVIEQILKSSIKRTTKWHMQCDQYLTNQNKIDKVLSNQQLECVSEKRIRTKGSFQMAR